MKLEILIERVFGKEYNDDYNLEDTIEVEDNEVDFKDSEKMGKLLDDFCGEGMEWDDIYSGEDYIIFGYHMCGDWDDPTYVNYKIRKEPERMKIYWATHKETGDVFKSKRGNTTWARQNHMTLAINMCGSKDNYNYHSIEVEVNKHGIRE